MEKVTHDQVLRLLLESASGDTLRREKAVNTLWNVGANNRKHRSLCRIGIRAAASDPSLLVRNVATEALGEIGNSSDLHRLRWALHDKDWLVRATAASSYAAVGKSRAIPRLVRVMRNDPHEVVRAYAAQGLGDIGDRTAMAPLLAQIETEQEGRALVGIHTALILLGRPEQAAPLARLIQSEEWHPVQDATMNSLDELIDDGLIPEPFASDVRRELEVYAVREDIVEWRRTMASTIAGKIVAG